LGFLPKFSPKLLWFPQKRFHFLVRLPNGFRRLSPTLVWITKFGYLGNPNNQITEYFVTQITEYLVIRVTQITNFIPIIQEIGQLCSKPNSVNPHPCQSVCWSLCTVGHFAKKLWSLLTLLCCDCPKMGDSMTWKNFAQLFRWPE
jgi:hypothetical protein